MKKKNKEKKGEHINSSPSDTPHTESENVYDFKRYLYIYIYLYAHTHEERVSGRRDVCRYSAAAEPMVISGCFSRRYINVDRLRNMYTTIYVYYIITHERPVENTIYYNINIYND